MFAQLDIGRELSNLLDTQLGVPLSERRVDCLLSALVLLYSIEERSDRFEEVHIAINLTKERLVESEFARKDEARDALHDLLNRLRQLPRHWYQLDHDHLALHG